MAPEDEYVELGEMEEESAADAESKDKVRVDVDAKPGLNRFKLAALRVMRENAVAKRLAMFKALRATDMTSSYAAEYTGAVEAKTVAFHRRLERGCDRDRRRRDTSAYQLHAHEQCGGRAVGHRRHSGGPRLPFHKQWRNVRRRARGERRGHACGLEHARRQPCDR